MTGIDQRLVAAAIRQLQEFGQTNYLEALAVKRLTEGDLPLQIINGMSYCMVVSSMSNQTNLRYHVKCYCTNIGELVDVDPVTKLALHLYKRMENNTNITTIDFRFDMGLMTSLTPYWHVDPWKGQTVSFSNKPNWSTYMQKSTIPVPLADPILIYKGDPEYQEYEANRVACILGQFYDIEQWHRSPIPSDIPPVLEDEYRLFARLADIKYDDPQMTQFFDKIAADTRNQTVTKELKSL